MHLAGRIVPFPPARPFATLLAANDAAAETPEDAPTEVSASARRDKGSWQVRLGAHRSRRQAVTALERLRKGHPRLVKAHAPTIVGDAGRDKTAPRTRRLKLVTDSRASADALCARLKSALGACVVQRN